MRKWPLMLLLLAGPMIIASGTACADDNPFRQKEAEDHGADRLATIRITGRVCQKVVKHRPDTDVIYRPGVDVEGNPVTPADLPGSRADFSLPDTVAFDLPLNPFHFIGRPDLAELFPDAAFSVGRVEYDLLSGDVMLNGQSLNGDQEAALAAACLFFADQYR